MFLLFPSCLQNFNKIKEQLLCHQVNVKISSFYDPKLYIKNKFIDWIVNNIWFERNLICMLRNREHEIQWLDFQNLHQKKKYIRSLKSFSPN